MARGSQIIVSGNPKGVFLAGIAGDTSKPGTIMDVKAATAIVGTQFTYVASNGTEGRNGLCAVLLANTKNGLGVTAASVVGQQIEMYVPAPGEDINVLVGEVAGTGNSYAIGDRLMLDAEDGILVPEASTPEDSPFIIMEALVQVVGSNLTWVRKLS